MVVDNFLADDNIQFITELNNSQLLIGFDSGSFLGTRSMVLSVENDGSLPEEYSQFESALDNDLDTPGALAVFFEWVRKTNIKLGSGSLQEKEAVIGLNFLDKVNSIFDLIQEKIEIPMEILDLVNVRQKARQKNDWVLSDKLRDKIYDLGWTVEDTLTGQMCKPLKS